MNKEPRISIVIPHVPASKQLEELLQNCIKSLENQSYHRLIIVVNDAIGYGAAFNRGFSVAQEDFIIGVSNDTELIDGNLQDMCDPKAVTYASDAQWGCFFCLPRFVLSTIGGFDTRIGKAYFEDDNYLSRLKRAGIPVRRIPTIKVFHIGGVTVKTIGNENEFMNKARPIYEQIEKELDKGMSLFVPLI